MMGSLVRGIGMEANIYKKYQGREFTTTLQANTEGELNGMISSLNVYARGMGLGRVDVVQKRRDPDGGWEAIVRAHNWNPIKWIKSKVEEHRMSSRAKEGREREEGEFEEEPVKGERYETVEERGWGGQQRELLALPAGRREEEPVKGEWYGSQEEAMRGRPQYERRSEPLEHENIYRYREDWDEGATRAEARRQAAEDAYQEQVGEELRRQGVGREESHREEIDRLMREEEERMKRERMEKRETEAEREKLKFERERLEALKQAQKLERQKMGFESREMRRKESGKMIEGLRKTATLGGPIRMSERTASLYGASGMRRLVAPPQRPKPSLDKLRDALLVGGGAQQLHQVGGMRQLHGVGGMRQLHGVGEMRRATIPATGMRELTMVPSRGRMAYGGTRGLAELMMPKTQRLQSLTMISGIGQTPIARASSLAGTRHLAKPMGYRAKTQQTNDVVYRRMRALAMATGMSQTEQVAYAEIRGNHDADTREHVVEELAKLGISRAEATRAIDSLMRQGLVKRGDSFRGEPVLEVAG